MAETGLTDKIVLSIMNKAAEVFKNNEDNKDPKNNDYSKEYVVKVMPAVGPYLIGMQLSLLGFLYERMQDKLKKNATFLSWVCTPLSILIVSLSVFFLNLIKT